MELFLSTRSRLFGAALLMALAAGCGGRGGSDDLGIGAPAPAPVPSPPPAVEVRGWSNPFGSAAVVFGQTGFDQVDPQGTGATPISSPGSAPVVVEDGRLLVATGDKLLAFDRLDANGPVASMIYDLFAAFGSQVAGGLSVQGDRLVVASANQVHIFNPAPGSQSERPVVSSPERTNGCDASHVRQPQSAVLTPLGQLIVVDTFNNRVLIWNAVPDTGDLSEPDLVLGQRNMISCLENDDDGNGIVDAASNGTMYFPTSVWSDGVRLIVADTRNHRLLVWDSFPTPADLGSHRANRVIGQGSFSDSSPNRGMNSASATSLAFPRSIDVSESGELAVADQGNNRVLIWSSIPTQGEGAAFVVGQSDFTHNQANDVNQIGVEGALPSAKTLSSPSGVRFHGRNLIVSDTGNDRLLIWRERE